MQPLQMFMARTPAGENTDTPRFENYEGYSMCSVPVACYERLMWWNCSNRISNSGPCQKILYTPSYFLKPALKSTRKALSDLAQLCVGTEGNGHANWKSPQRPLQILPGLRAVSSFCRSSCSMCASFYRHYCKTKSSEIANMCYSSTLILWAPDFSLTGSKPLIAAVVSLVTSTKEHTEAQWIWFKGKPAWCRWFSCRFSRKPIQL